MKPILVVLAFCIMAVIAIAVIDAAPVAVDPLAAAQTQAAAAKKPLYVLVGAEWCQGCKWVEKKYATKMESTGVYVHLDWNRHVGPIRRLGIAIASLPTLIVIDTLGHRHVHKGPAEIKAAMEAKK